MRLSSRFETTFWWCALASKILVFEQSCCIDSQSSRCWPCSCCCSHPPLSTPMCFGFFTITRWMAGPLIPTKPPVSVNSIVDFVTFELIGSNFRMRTIPWSSWATCLPTAPATPSLYSGNLCHIIKLRYSGRVSVFVPRPADRVMYCTYACLRTWSGFGDVVAQ